MIILEDNKWMSIDLSKLEIEKKEYREMDETESKDDSIVI